MQNSDRFAYDIICASHTPLPPQAVPLPLKGEGYSSNGFPLRGSCHEVTEEVFCFSTSSASLSLGTFPLRGRLLRGELIIYVNFNCTGFVRTHTQPPLQPPTTGGEQKILLCHPERSEGSLQIKILHSVQNDIPDCPERFLLSILRHGFAVPPPFQRRYSSSL